MKFTAFIDESVEKGNQFPANMEAFKILLELSRKRLLEKNIYFLVIYPSFRGSNFVQFGILSVLYTNKETPKAILLINFDLF